MTAAGANGGEEEEARWLLRLVVRSETPGLHFLVRLVTAGLKRQQSFVASLALSPVQVGGRPRAHTGREAGLMDAWCRWTSC